MKEIDLELHDAVERFKFDVIRTAVKNMREADKMAYWNAYAELMGPYSGRFEIIHRNNVENLRTDIMDTDSFSDSSVDAMLCGMSCGKYRYTDEYVVIRGNGSIFSSDRASSFIMISTLVSRMIEKGYAEDMFAYNMSIRYVDLLKSVSTVIAKWVRPDDYEKTELDIRCALNDSAKDLLKEDWTKFVTRLAVEVPGFSVESHKVNSIDYESRKIEDILNDLAYCNRYIKKSAPSWISKSNFYAKKRLVIQYIVNHRADLGVDVLVDPMKYTQDDVEMALLTINAGIKSFTFHQILGRQDDPFTSVLKELGFDGRESVEYVSGHDNEKGELSEEEFDERFRRIVDFISKAKYGFKPAMARAYRYVCNELRGRCMMKDTTISSNVIKVLDVVDGKPDLSAPGKDMSLKKVCDLLATGKNKKQVIKFIEEWISKL